MVSCVVKASAAQCWRRQRGGGISRAAEAARQQRSDSGQRGGGVGSVRAATQHGSSGSGRGGSLVAAGSRVAGRQWQWRQRGSWAAASAARQLGGGVGSAAAAVAAAARRWRPAWQLGGSAASLAAAPQQDAQRQRQLAGSTVAAATAPWQRGGGGHGRGSHLTAVLPPRAAAVAKKTPVATAMAGSQTTINNQLKAVAAMAMETATMTHIAGITLYLTLPSYQPHSILSAYAYRMSESCFLIDSYVPDP